FKFLGGETKIVDPKEVYSPDSTNEIVESDIPKSEQEKSVENIGKFNKQGIRYENNIKNRFMYSNKELFLISDKEWRNVLPLTSLAMWTDSNGNIHKYPILIYHEESSVFDAGSIILFMQQYNPDRVTIIGQTPNELDNLLIDSSDLGAGLSNNQIQKITVNNYLSYWSSFDGVVYVENKYELALLASVYASLINAPLIIQGTNLDSQTVFSDKKIICIGSVSPAGSICSEQYNLEQLRKKYVDETNTNKIILVNPNDLNLALNSKSLSSVNKLYGSNSLSSPFLATAKSELLVTAQSSNIENIDNELESVIRSVGINPKYLTIIASPNAIPQSKKIGEGTFGDKRIEVDNSVYGSLDSDKFPEMAVGRIYGLTISDVSSYIARSIFLEPEFGGSVTLIGAPDTANTLAGIVGAYNDAFKQSDYNTITYDFLKEDKEIKADDLRNRKLHIYVGHGSFSSLAHGLGSKIQLEDVGNLYPMVFVGDGCSSCDFETASTSSPELLFCANVIKHGAMAYLGAVGTAIDGEIDSIIFSYHLGNGLTVGEAFKKTKEDLGMERFILIGDPTFNPKMKSLKIDSLNKQKLNPSINFDEDKKVTKAIIDLNDVKFHEDGANLDRFSGLYRYFYFPEHKLIQFETTPIIMPISNEDIKEVNVKINIIGKEYDCHLSSATEGSEKFIFTDLTQEWTAYCVLPIPMLSDSCGKVFDSCSSDGNCCQPGLICNDDKFCSPNQIGALSAIWALYEDSGKLYVKISTKYFEENIEETQMTGLQDVRLDISIVTTLT
ncbi:MAG: C25 family cysteine peptidase, partial [Nanoarchaeota archaeon]